MGWITIFILYFYLYNYKIQQKVFLTRRLIRIKVKTNQKIRLCKALHGKLHYDRELVPVQRKI